MYEDKTLKIIDDELTCPLSCGSFEEDMQFWVSQFLEQKELEKVAPKTLKSYKDALKTFLLFVSKYKDNTMDTIGAKFINRYLIEYQASLASKKLEELHKKNIVAGELYEKYKIIEHQAKEKFLGKNDAHFKILPEFENSLDHRLTVIKMLLKYISDNNKEEHDYTPLFRKFATIKHKDKFTEYITVEEMDEVIDFMSIWTDIHKQYKPKSKTRAAYRDSLLIILYALTGARSEEVVKIRLKDISLFKHNGKEYYRIKIQEGKGGKVREVGVEAGFIKKHIEFLKQELPSSDYYIASTYDEKTKTYKNKHVHQDTIRRFGNYVLEILGINKKGLHTFRRGYATKRIVHDKAELAVVAKEMGNTAGVLEKYYLKHNAEMVN